MYARQYSWPSGHTLSGKRMMWVSIESFDWKELRSQFCPPVAMWLPASLFTKLKLRVVIFSPKLDNRKMPWWAPKLVSNKTWSMPWNCQVGLSQVCPAQRQPPVGQRVSAEIQPTLHSPHSTRLHPPKGRGIISLTYTRAPHGPQSLTTAQGLIDLPL